MAFSISGDGAGGGAHGPQINVTPLIDVLLTLIVLFMLVVAMDPEYGEKAQIPQPPKDQKSTARNRRHGGDSGDLDVERFTPNSEN